MGGGKQRSLLVADREGVTLPPKNSAFSVDTDSTIMIQRTIGTAPFEGGEAMVRTTGKTNRVIAHAKIKDVKRALNSLSEARPAEMSKSEVIRELRKEIETARNKGYDNKQIAQIFTEQTGTTFTAPDIRTALKHFTEPDPATTEKTTDISTAQ